MAQVKLSSEWLDVEKTLGGRPVLGGTYQEVRAAYQDVGTMLAQQWGEPDRSVATEEKDIGKGIKVRIYTPPHANGNLPIGVFAHGGAYIVGNLDSEDHLCRYVCKNTPCIIVSVEYHLAPEHQLPQAQQDCLYAFGWAYDHASEFGGDSSRTFSFGGSAGGALALGVAVALVENGSRSKIAGTVALVPVTLHPDNVPDRFKPAYKSYQENAKDVPFIDKAGMMYFFDVAGANKLKDDPTVFPGMYKNMADLPPTWIATCGADVLRDDGTVMVQALEEAGVKTRLSHYPELPHYFWIFPSVTAGNRFREDVVQGVKFVLA